MNVGTKLIGLMCLTAAGYLAQAAHSEWKISEIYWSKPEVSAAVLGGTQLDKQYSYNTSREILTRCVTTISSKHFAGLVDAEKSAVVLNCRDFAHSLVEKNTPQAEAHLLLALLGDDARAAGAVQQNLTAAQNLAPRDQFNVEWRLILAHRVSHWSGGALTGYDCARDLQLLEAQLPSNRTLAFLRDKNASLLERCAA